MHSTANGVTPVMLAAPSLSPGIFSLVTPQVPWHGWMGPKPAGLRGAEGEICCKKRVSRCGLLSLVCEEGEVAARLKLAPFPGS